MARTEAELTRRDVVVFTTPVDLSGQLSNLSEMLADLIE
jgi:hypothetical protein